MTTPKRVICMPVGPNGVKPATLQMIVSLVKDGTIQAITTAESHVVPARNMVWGAACCAGAEFVLWVDADIYARPDLLIEFIKRAEEEFTARQTLAWRGAICRRRGGGLAMYQKPSGEIMLGLGLAYWHVERCKAAFVHATVDPHAPFDWVPPYSEDYGACNRIYAAGYHCDYDDRLPTSHAGVGEWWPRDPEDDSPVCEACGGMPAPSGCRWCNDGRGPSGGLT